MLSELEKYNTQRTVGSSDPLARVDEDDVEPEHLDIKERLGKQLGEVKDAMEAAVAEDSNHSVSYTHLTLPTNREV